MWERILELERRIEELAARLARAEALATQNGQSLAMVWSNPDQSGGSVASYWCQTPSGGGPATGTWGSVTPDSFTADVYSTVGGVQTPIATGATIYWWYNDTFAANKPIPLMANGNGSYDAIAEGCTAF